MPTYRPRYQPYSATRSQQPGKQTRIRRLQPSGLMRRHKDHRHAVMNGSQIRRGFGREDGEGLERCIAAPALPKPGKGYRPAVSSRDMIGLLGTVARLPFIEPVCRNQTAAAAKGGTER